MLKQIIKYKWYLLVVLILMIAEPTLNSIMNFLLQRMFNSATPSGSIIELLRLLSAGFLLWMLKRIIIYSNGVIKARFICNAKRDIRHRVFIRTMGLDTSNIADIASSGEYISVFTNDITLLETRFYNQLLGLLSGLFSLAILGTSFIALNGLDNGYQCQAARASRTEQGQYIKGRHGAKLITEEDDAVFQLAAVLIRYGEKFTGEVLDHQTRHEVFCSILLR